MNWKHFGFSVHNGVRVARNDEKEREALRQYSIRNTFGFRFYPTPNHISPVISLCILIFKFPIAINPIISLKFSMANSRNSSSSSSSMRICFCILNVVSASILPLLNCSMQFTNFSKQSSDIWCRYGLTFALCQLGLVITVFLFLL